MPAVGPHVTAAIAAGWAAAAPTVHGRMDAAMDARLDAAFTAAAGDAAGTADSAVVDLFDTLHRAIAAAAVVAVVGPAFAAAHGDATVAGVMTWPPIAWGVPALWFPGVTRVVRRRAAAAFAAARRALDAAAAAARDAAAATPPEPDTYLAVLAAALRDAAGPGGAAAGVTPPQVGVHLLGALVGATINTAATAGWAAAHVAADAAARAAVTAEVDAVMAGRPPPVAAAAGGDAAAACVTGLPTLESAWAEARRFYFAIPAVRFARSPLVVAAADGGGGGWTVPGDGGAVLLSVLDASRGADYYEDGDTYDARRFLPAAAGGGGVSATAAAADGRLYGLGWGPDAAASTAESQLLLSRLWRRLYTRYDVTLVAGRKRGGGAGSDARTPPLPPADQLRAVATALPTRRVWARLTRRRRREAAGGGEGGERA